jgi:hypothetical protein
LFVGWTAAFAVYWDLHFFVAHKAAHDFPAMYQAVHKLHHSHKQPGVFTAYYVTYQSHVLTEQLVVLIAAACGLPRDVLTWTLFWGTLGTYVEHCGHDLHDVQLIPLFPLTFGQLSTILSPWSLVLGGESAAHHDWHHETFNTNYALSFTYLDQLFGTFHPGRVPGEALGLDPRSLDQAAEMKMTAVGRAEAKDEAKDEAKEAKGEAKGEAKDIPKTKAGAAKKLPTAQYLTLKGSTKADWVVQGAAFDKYAADGNIVRNVLELVEKMKVGGERASFSWTHP